MKIDYTKPVAEQIDDLITHVLSLNEQPSYLYLGRTTYQVLISELDLPENFEQHETAFNLQILRVNEEHHLDIS